jgi:hypothetical protein
MVAIKTDLRRDMFLYRALRRDIKTRQSKIPAWFHTMTNSKDKIKLIMGRPGEKDPAFDL